MRQLLHRYKTWANKEPPTREQAYWSIVLPWLSVGLLVALAIATWKIGHAESITLAVCAAVIAIVLYWVDRKQGYADAIYKHRVKRREEWLSETKSTKE